ncbi:MAG TPA: serine hydrolase domain-containing protein [Chthonomonadaceae bacterium]|nr:serine hydrolase domain-containing protein [Chthonomonadaceae bacterium]
MNKPRLSLAPFVVALHCLISIPVRADKVDDYIKRQMETRHIPGVSVAVVRAGKPILLRGYGLANVEANMPATKDTVYQLASVTKQFTATAVMILVQERKISLDAKITTYLSDLPTAWNQVTVRNLLTHTSGIKSYTNIPPRPDLSTVLRKDRTPMELISTVAEEPLEFPPGERWDYSNTNFILLGVLIEKMSGKSYGDFLKERIFTPLGMTATRVNNLYDIIKNRAAGYSFKDGRLYNGEYVSPTGAFSAGALVTTVVDMTKWDAALYSDLILPQPVLQQMWRPTKLNNGSFANYGFGWSVDTYYDRKLIEHGGGIPGFSTQICRFVDDKLTIIVLTNLDTGDANTLAKGIASLYLPAFGMETRNRK